MMHYRWQDYSIAYLARMAYFALIVECGCGKTLAAIRIALVKHLPVIVIAPKNLCSQWKEDIQAIAGPEADIWVHSVSEETKRGDDYLREMLLWAKDGIRGNK